MLVLLPPSEGKTAPDDGAPLDLTTLGSPRLTRQRRAVLSALIKVSRRKDALQVLGAGASLAAEVARNTRLRTGPAAPASSVYSGVLYAAAGLDDLPDDAARARADRSVRIVSGLWGLVTPADRIPAYRLSMRTALPGVGPLARAWRPLLAAELDPWAVAGLVVDCRSAPYAAAWSPPSGTTGWVAVRVLREADGRRTVVSHNAKHTRGVLTRHLLTRPGAEPACAEELMDVARELIGPHLLDAELTGAPAPTRPATLTLTVA